MSENSAPQKMLYLEIHSQIIHSNYRPFSSIFVPSPCAASLGGRSLEAPRISDFTDCPCALPDGTPLVGQSFVAIDPLNASEVENHLSKMTLRSRMGLFGALGLWLERLSPEDLRDMVELWSGVMFFFVLTCHAVGLDEEDERMRMMMRRMLMMMMIGVRD